METFNQQKLPIPKIDGQIISNLEETLKEYDKIVFNHIKNHYYGGQMTTNDQNEIKELMEITKKHLYYQDN
jgi:hypothetical protein